jgi:hypothetical protein
MRVFISFAERDAELAAELEATLRRNAIQTLSRLDVASGGEWKRVVDQESASADGFVFLLGEGTSADPELRAEWRSLLRNDWDSKKTLVPVIHPDGGLIESLPPFLRNRKAIYTSNFDDALAVQIQALLERPVADSDAEAQITARAEREKRLNELRNYALALKEDSAGREATPN